LGEFRKTEVLIVEFSFPYTMKSIMSQRKAAKNRSLKTSPRFDLLFLDKVILLEILLNMNSTDLKAIVALKHPQIIKIISSNEFKRLYDIKHKVNHFTLGKKSYDSDSLIIRGNDGINLAVHIFLQIIYVEIVHKNPDFSFTIFLDLEHMIFMIKSQELAVDFIFQRIDKKWVSAKVAFGYIKDVHTFLENIKIVFEKRNRKNWLPYRENKILKIPQDFPREFYETFKAISNKELQNWPQ